MSELECISNVDTKDHNRNTDNVLNTFLRLTETQNGEKAERKQREREREREKMRKIQRQREGEEIGVKTERLRDRQAVRIVRK